MVKKLQLSSIGRKRRRDVREQGQPAPRRVPGRCQRSPGVGWLSYSTDGGRTWSAPIRVTADHDNAVHIVESAGAGPGIVDIAWLADNSPRGYATYMRPFSIKAGWLAPVTQVSSEFGNPVIWPGDTFGISVLPCLNGPAAPQHVALSWGSAVDGSRNSEIYATAVDPVTPGG